MSSNILRLIKIITAQQNSGTLKYGIVVLKCSKCIISKTSRNNKTNE